MPGGDTTNTCRRGSCLTKARTFSICYALATELPPNLLMISSHMRCSGFTGHDFLTILHQRGETFADDVQAFPENLFFNQQ